MSLADSLKMRLKSSSMLMVDVLYCGVVPFEKLLSLVTIAEFKLICCFTPIRAD
jgi:hypothetical protein